MRLDQFFLWDEIRRKVGDLDLQRASLEGIQDHYEYLGRLYGRLMDNR